MKLAGRERRPIAGKCIYVPLFAPFFLLQETVYETVKPKKPAMTPNPASASRSWRPMRQPFKDEKTMSPKPPPRGTVTVDIHPRPGLPSDGHVPLPDTLPRVDFGLPITTNPRNPSRTTVIPGDGDLDAIMPAPSVKHSIAITLGHSVTAHCIQAKVSRSAGNTYGAMRKGLFHPN
jgi:hypothetical protein